MKKDRGVLEKRLNDVCIDIAIDTESCNKIYNYIKDKYDVPRGLTSDFVCLRKSLSEASEFILFCLLDGAIELGKTKNNLSDFYTQQEIDLYSKSKYETEKIKFPLKFKMIQVESDQWIGKISAKELMKLRAAQLINYNVNAQRTMQRIVKGDKEVYKITLNESAVESIQENMESRLFIPNTITLNMPEDTDYYYDESSSELIIKSIRHFDSTDGFHRYIALCKANDKNPSFDYNMELRMISFPEHKAQRFIYQEDQKTQMKKLDSNSFNTSAAANVVAMRLNQNPMCNIQGLIERNGGIINMGEFADLIRYFCFRDLPKKDEKKRIISLVKEFTDDFNMITEYDEKYLSKRYSYKQLMIMIYMFNYYEDKDKTNMCEYIDRMVQRQDELDNKKFYNKVPRKAMVNDIERLMKEVKKDV